MGELINVEVVYALPREQVVVALKIEAGTTAAEAVRRSGIMQRFPEIDPDTARLGVFGRTAQPRRVLRAGDRVEIYRPLIADPKAARLKRSQRSAE